MKFLFWKKAPAPLDVLAEQLEVVIKAGRRCAYDLKHAASDVNDPEMRRIFSSRADTWLTIFAPVDGPKDYVSRLNREINQLQRDIRALKAEAKKHGLDFDYLDFWGDHDD